MTTSARVTLIAALIVSAAVVAADPPTAAMPSTETTAERPVPWDEIRSVPMAGDLRVFWDVAGGDVAYNREQATRHGFQIVDLVNTFSDYPGGQRENINTFVKGNPANPWRKPEFFERIVKQNIAASGMNAILVHDIEFEFEQDPAQAWADEAARKASGAKTEAEFAEAYFREWATWFTQPCIWAKEQRPNQPVGIYGPQPFRRDYWGIAGKDARQIDGTHARDADLWTHIDPAVDFVIASVYIFYDEPGAIYYIASNIEENVARARRFGTKPVYAYEWLRYHDGNKQLAGQEVAPYLAEAMAVLPFFTGARGLVLWGWEPKREGQYYERLPLFMNSLGRVSDLAEKIANATLMEDEPAHVLWKAKRPLVRRLRVTADEWIVLAVNPWQADDARSSVAVACDGPPIELAIEGRHTEIYHIRSGRAERLEAAAPAGASRHLHR